MNGFKFQLKCDICMPAAVPAALLRCCTCQRNSRVRRKGVGCLNSHRTTVFHWFSCSGRSLWLLIHCTAQSTS